MCILLTGFHIRWWLYFSLTEKCEQKEWKPIRAPLFDKSSDVCADRDCNVLYNNIACTSNHSMTAPHRQTTFTEKHDFKTLRSRQGHFTFQYKRRHLLVNTWTNKYPNPIQSPVNNSFQPNRSETFFYSSTWHLSCGVGVGMRKTHDMTDPHPKTAQEILGLSIDVPQNPGEDPCIIPRYLWMNQW